MNTILPDKITYKEINNIQAFWHYFFSVNYGNMVWQNEREDTGIQQWITEFTSLREKGHFQHIHTIFLPNGMWVSCYPDQVQYQHRTLPGEKLEEKRAWDWDTFQQQTHGWSAEEKLLCIPIVVIQPQEQEEFMQWMERAVQEMIAGSFPEKHQTAAQEDYLPLIPLIAQKQNATPGELRNGNSRKRVRIWMILFTVLILHFFLLPHLVPTQDTMGQEGLKRVIIQGLASLPAMFCLAGTILAEGIFWFQQKKREMAEIRKGYIMIWLFLLCVNGWWCAAETGTLVHAIQDWKIVTKVESIPEEKHSGETEAGIDCVSFRNWNIQKTSSMGVTRGYYLKDAARTFSFPLGKNIQRIQKLESYADQELTVYYYHYSQIPVRICFGNQVLAGN